jgi:hypothetical protein
MTMRLVLAGVMVLTAGIAQAQDWGTLTGPEIAEALTARRVIYETGAAQEFRADGVTTYESRGNISAGSWRVEGDRYCSQWPPRDAWDCYDLSRSADGLDLRFTGDAGDVTAGRYGDLE